MVTYKQFWELEKRLVKEGYAQELTWALDLKLCDNPVIFFWEYTWVVINSGMKNQVAEKIHREVQMAVIEGMPVSRAFNNKKKVEAIDRMRVLLRSTFDEFQGCEDDEQRLAMLNQLPFIGPITKYHLAKNLGMTSICKPDRHLQRLAQKHGEGTTPQKMCEQLADCDPRITVAYVDQVLWRAANLGYI